MIFVFGSNYGGRHGKGAALFAREHHGAIYGKREGLQGNSYAIPTKNSRMKSLPLETIKVHVDKFLDFARAHPELEFEVTPIGCGLAGYKYTDIAPMFKEAPFNCHLPLEFNLVIASLSLKDIGEP